MLDKVDVFKIILESESADTSVEASGQFNYKINLPSKKVNYTKIMLYVDNFQICLKGLTTESVQVQATLSQYNSYNSRTKANNTAIACVFNSNTASGRTADLTLQYQNSTAPIAINSLPNDLRIDLIEMGGAGIDMSAAAQFFELDLRIEAFYD